MCQLGPHATYGGTHCERNTRFEQLPSTTRSNPLKDLIESITQSIRESDSGHRNIYLLIFTVWLFARRWWEPLGIEYDSLVILEAAALSGAIRALHKLHIRYSRAGRFAALKPTLEECRSSIQRGWKDEPRVREMFDILNAKLKRLRIASLDPECPRESLDPVLQRLIVQATERERKRARKGLHKETDLD